MKEFRFNVNKELCEALENAQLSKNSLLELYTFSLGNQEKFGIPDEKIDKLMNQYLAESVKYEQLKAEVEKVFVGVDKTKASWSLDFESGVVIVNEAD